MEEKKIITLTREELLAKRIQKGIYYKGCFISDLMSHVDSPISENIFKYPYRIEGFFLLICKQGSGTIKINLEEHEIADNSLLIHQPNNIIQMMQRGENIQGVVLGFDKEFTQEINFDLKHFLPIALALKDQPLLKINEKQCDRLFSLIKEIAYEIQHQENAPFHEEIMRNYFTLFFHKLCSIMSLNLPAKSGTESSVKSRNEEYFQKFMKVLSENYKRERNLAFYASQLCITPKYLTTLIKRISGRSAAEWIDEYVTLEAKNLLRYSTMSIQEVAFYLHFPNQSFFGKYFKHQTGYTPSAYKMLK